MFSLQRNLNQLRKLSNQSRSKSYIVNLDNINQNVKRIEYAVRGPLVIRAGEIEKELKAGTSNKSFSEVIRANIGDCHATGQKPLTYFRQVIACCTDTSLLDSPKYPNDVKEKVKLLLSYCGGNSVGAYSDSAGIEIARQHCAEYIAERDGIPSNWQDIVLTTGASEGVRAVLALINSSSTDDKPSGVLIPIPQYPLYTATIAEYAMHPIKYYLDEENEWQLNIKELKRALDNDRSLCKPKAIVIINPGNPTGSVLSKENIKEIIKFAKEEGLMIIADEVYQHNIYKEGAAFHSFKKVMHEMGLEIELASLMSSSKGYMGECGLRGGYCEFINLQPEVKALFLKMLSARLCCSILGQIAMDCVVSPPKPGDQSYDLFASEKNAILESLKAKAKLAAETFNSIPNMKSNPVAGAMYAFPQIILPEKAIKEARDKNMEPDFFYAKNLLEKTGICIVPGSGFGQIPGTYHFRTTILPQLGELRKMMDRLKVFHLQFLEDYK
ncbi:alanine aminotransferase 2-like [Tetranychus urticae]|uniref:alanine transaminase n=1 Tax=Tetranychus urticae TaxID=32264 RepID=T1KXX0_TETUR|nr:alanine aminotransferase 2-like [Tetranychus urticae]XP_015791721.1 alanine aminotransferase 2-like [Tetranychus urticae]